jgi:hypothetical protein
MAGVRALDFRQRCPFRLGNVVAMDETGRALMVIEDSFGGIDGVVVVGMADGTLPGFGIALPPGGSRQKLPTVAVGLVHDEFEGSVMSLTHKKHLPGTRIPDRGIGVFQDLAILDFEQVGVITLRFEFCPGAGFHGGGQPGQRAWLLLLGGNIQDEKKRKPDSRSQENPTHRMFSPIS